MKGAATTTGSGGTSGRSDLVPDQFLRAHEMMEYVYNVADVAYPVSIRD